MKTIWSTQYLTRCIVLEVGDDVDDVLDTAIQEECIVPEDGEDCFVVQFPGREYPEAYTEKALRKSFPIRVW